MGHYNTITMQTHEKYDAFLESGLVLGNGSNLGRHLEYWSYARFAKVANARFQNYRARRTFWYIETNVVLRRPPTPISKLLFEPYLLHYHIQGDQSSINCLLFFLKNIPKTSICHQR